MAWIDDRIWCHPKFADISSGAAWLWVKAVAYSAGFGTRGRLTEGQLKTIGCGLGARRELVNAGLWLEDDEGVLVNDWDDHNGKRDDRRERDRQRKKEARAEGRWNEADRPKDGARPKSAPKSAPKEAPARVEGSEGSDSSVTTVTGTEILVFTTTRTVLGAFIDEARAAGVDVPTRVKGQLARGIKDLLDEGQSVQAVAAGLRRMVERRRIIPSQLPAFVMEAQLPARNDVQRYGRGLTTEQIREMGAS